jgi:hypothetical protein
MSCHYGAIPFMGITCHEKTYYYCYNLGTEFAFPYF